MIVPILVFVVAAAYFISLSSTVPTFFNVNSDAPLFITAAKFFRISHPSPGSPLYNLINMAWLHSLPFSSDYFSLTVLNALCSSAVAAVLYMMTRNILAPLIWLAAGVVVTQSTILEQYTMTVLFMLVSYWCYRSDKRSWAYALASFGIMVNHLAGFCILAYLANDVYQKNTLKPFLWSFIALPLLAYLPLFNRPPYHLIEDSSLFAYYDYFFGGHRGLLGGLAIIPTDDAIERLWEFTRIIIGGLGTALILIVLGIKKVWKESFVLPMIFVLPSFHYLTNLDAMTYTYTIVTIAFGAILACQHEWKFAKAACIVGAIVLIGFNIQWFDFGRTLDPNQTQVSWYKTLDKLPSDAVLQVDRAGCCAVLWVDLYNMENGTTIRNIKKGIVDTPPSERGEFIDIVKQAEKEGKLYEAIILDTDYNVGTFKIKSDDLVKFIQDPFAPRKPFNEKAVISRVDPTENKESPPWRNK
tara:strand:+ start:87 stop:1496 length:1410 start_codon:yes stop_codon:yes gene_type:complete